MGEETPLRRARVHLGWSADTALRRLAQLARVHDIPIATDASLKTLLSRWENGRRSVGEAHYRRLLCELYGRTPAELGFPEDDHVDEGAEELRARLTIARSVDDGVVELFRAHLDIARRADRRFGAVTQLAVVRSHIAEIERLLRFGVPTPLRAALAGLLAEAATLAGWQALDRVALRSSWDLHETAVLAAREAESAPLLAHAVAQQALVLVDLGEPDIALAYVGDARALGAAVAPALLRAWLCCVEAEVRAAAADPDGALRAFDDAERLIPTERRDPELPFVFLSDGHLERWRGRVLTAVGDPRAVAELELALERVPADFVRARSSTLVDLAFATAATGERGLARAYAREARRVAGQVASDRQLRRLRRLRLPGTVERGRNDTRPNRQRISLMCTTRQARRQGGSPSGTSVRSCLTPIAQGPRGPQRTARDRPCSRSRLSQGWLKGMVGLVEARALVAGGQWARELRRGLADRGRVRGAGRRGRRVSTPGARWGARASPRRGSRAVH